jgi:hypothetical protein
MKAIAVFITQRQPIAEIVGFYAILTSDLNREDCHAG